jgi:hypothetical protein
MISRVRCGYDVTIFIYGPSTTSNQPTLYDSNTLLLLQLQQSR